MDRLDRLQQFVQTYLGADEEHDMTSAVRSFVRDEGPEAAGELRLEIREWLSIGAPLDEIRRLFSEEGQFLLSASDVDARAQLLDAFEGLSHEAFGLQNGGTGKPYDVFISYSSSDQGVANRLALALKNKGFAVWLDRWEILVGHNIVDEVFRGIANSEFLIVLLSAASTQSQWVREELTTAKVAEIEQRRVTILPAVVEKCDIPNSLRNKRFADLTESWDQGLRELAAAIEFHRAEEQYLVPDGGSTERRFDQLERFRNQIDAETFDLGFTQDIGFKAVAIGPPDDAGVRLELPELLPLIESSRVEISGWGGPPFPYEPTRDHEIIRLPTGVRVFDTRPWPYQQRSLHFWQLNQDLQFLEKSHLPEDSAQNTSGDLFLQGKLGIEWALLDIVRPLVFATRILSRERLVGALEVSFVWGGLNQRDLTLLNPRRLGLRRQHSSGVDQWTRRVEIDLSTDLFEAAQASAQALFWLFGWEAPTDFLNQHLETLIQGQMPR